MQLSRTSNLFTTSHLAKYPTSTGFYFQLIFLNLWVFRRVDRLWRPFAKGRNRLRHLKYLVDMFDLLRFITRHFFHSVRGDLRVTAPEKIRTPRASRASALLAARVDRLHALLLATLKHVLKVRFSVRLRLRNAERATQLAVRVEGVVGRQHVDVRPV